MEKAVVSRTITSKDRLLKYVGHFTHYMCESTNVYKAYIDGVKFIKCTFVINDPGFSIYFSHCIFIDCTFKKTVLNSVVFDKCILIDIKTNKCVINELGFDFKYCIKAENEYEESKVINNVDFTGIEYNDLYCLLYDYELISKCFKRMIDNKVIKINKPISIPKIGESFIGYKIVNTTVFNKHHTKHGYMIAKLEIPKDARRVNTYSKKCRAERVKVLDFINVDIDISKEDFDESKPNLIGYPPMMGPGTRYIIGYETHSDSLDEDELDSCSNGIHFFISIEDALEYYFGVCKKSSKGAKYNVQTIMDYLINNKTM